MTYSEFKKSEDFYELDPKWANQEWPEQQITLFTRLPYYIAHVCALKNCKPFRLSDAVLAKAAHYKDVSDYLNNVVDKLLI